MKKKENVEIHLVDIKELRKKESTSAFKPPLHEAFQFKSLRDSPPGYSTSSLLAAVISPEPYVKEEGKKKKTSYNLKRGPLCNFLYK